MVSVADRVTSTTYSGQHGDHTTVDTVPEVWIADASGQEQRFCSAAMTQCRTGHEVLVISDPSGVLGMGNLSTGKTWLSHRLDIEPILWEFLVLVVLKTVGFGFFLLLMGAIVTQGRSGAAMALFSWIFLFGTGACLVLPIRNRIGSNQRNAALRARIKREVEAAS